MAYGELWASNESPRTTRAGHHGELELTALPLLSAVLARVDLGFDRGQRLLDGNAYGVIAGRGVNVGSGHANQDARLKTWAGFRSVREPHGRFLNALAFAQHEQAGLNQSNNRHGAVHVVVLEDEVHAIRLPPHVRFYYYID